MPDFKIPMASSRKIYRKKVALPKCMSALIRIFDYVQSLKRVRAEYGISAIRQVSEIIHLFRCPGRIGLGDYYAYRLFDDSLSIREKETFVGWRAEAWLDSLNEFSWHCIGLDKVLMYSMFASNGIRFPNTSAVYLPGFARPLAGASNLCTADELRSWLRNPSNYPFFSKPSASGFARDTFFAERYDDQLDCIWLKEGIRLSIDDFENAFHDHERLGYLFQKPIETDPRLANPLGTTISSLRMMVLVDESQAPLLHRCFWKLPTGSNTHDNYEGGKSGNLAAAIDHSTGQITRVIRGFGLDVEDVTYHPDTGVKLDTVAVPDWGEVVDFTFKAALQFPKLRFQQWDIALSKDGPMALEVNLFGTGGGTASQLLYRKGLFDDTMKSFLSRNGLWRADRSATSPMVNTNDQLV